MKNAQNMNKNSLANPQTFQNQEMPKLNLFSSLQFLGQNQGQPKQHSMIGSETQPLKSDGQSLTVNKF